MFEQTPLAGLHELRLPGTFWAEVLAALRRRRAQPQYEERDQRPHAEYVVAPRVKLIENLLREAVHPEGLDLILPWPAREFTHDRFAILAAYIEVGLRQADEHIDGSECG